MAFVAALGIFTFVALGYVLVTQPVWKLALSELAWAKAWMCYLGLAAFGAELRSHGMKLGIYTCGRRRWCGFSAYHAVKSGQGGAGSNRRATATVGRAKIGR